MLTEYAIAFRFSERSPVCLLVGVILITEHYGLNHIPRMDRTWNFGLYCRFLLPLLRRDREGSHGN